MKRYSTYTEREYEELRTWWISLSEDDAADAEKAERYFLLEKQRRYHEDLEG